MYYIQISINTKHPENIVIFTDSLSALQDLESHSHKTNMDVITLTQSLDKILNTFKIQITLQWIPGHIGIQGNETADELARVGAAMEQIERPLNLQTVKQILKNNSKEKWMNRWATGNTGRTVYKEMSEPKKNDSINKLKRAHQCTIFQWRTTHAKTNLHLNRINPGHAPTCRKCNAPYKTVAHILLECPKLQTPRRELLPP